MIPSLILIMQSEHVYNISWILAINTTAHINAHTMGDLLLKNFSHGIATVISTGTLVTGSL
jgi:hypothetical protein